MRSSPGLRAVLLASALGLLGGCAADDSASPTPITLDPGTECEARYGTEPWIVVIAGAEPVECVAVGSHQDVQIWNKGFDPIVVDWFGERSLSPDDHLATGPIGHVLDPGAYAVAAAPSAVPLIDVVDAADSISAELEPGASSLGPISLGMTVAEAAQALGVPVAVDPDLAPGPTCWQAVVTGDPYSPILTVEGDGSHDPVIVGILVAYPPGVAPIGTVEC